MVWGVDFGSRAVKIVLLENGKIQKTEIHETISFYRKCRLTESGKLQIIDETIGPGGNNSQQPVVTTGYGRNMLTLENSYQIPETLAHALGGQYLTGLSDFLLIDIGGQDSKVILVEKGRIADFIMNDKCAASSGRYLENMALGENVDNPIDLDSTCAIFGESELISKLVEGAPLPSLCAGVNYSIFKRLTPMLARFSSQVILLSGGVSQNKALQQIIRENLAAKQVIVLPKAQFAGAIGCAQWYWQKQKKNS